MVILNKHSVNKTLDADENLMMKLTSIQKMVKDWNARVKKSQKKLECKIPKLSITRGSDDVVLQLSEAIGTTVESIQYMTNKLGSFSDLGVRDFFTETQSELKQMAYQNLDTLNLFKSSLKKFLIVTDQFESIINKVYVSLPESIKKFSIEPQTAGIFEDDHEVEIVSGGTAGLGTLVLGLTAMLGKFAHNYWKNRRQGDSTEEPPNNEMTTYTFTSPAVPNRPTIVQLLPSAPTIPYNSPHRSNTRAIEHVPH
jgi:hypothetical protein